MTRDDYLRRKRETAARWRANHPEEYRATIARYRSANKVMLNRRASEAKKRKYAANLEKERAAAKERYWANLDTMRERARRYAADHPDAGKVRAQAWRKANPERTAELKRRALERRKERWAKFLEDERKRYRAGYAADPGKYSAKGAARRSAKLRATPPWADLSSIADIYRRAQQISLQTGIAHDVDHIIPLRGEHVCGLHIAENLQIIPASLNRRKQTKVL